MDIRVDPGDLAEKLTMVGLEVKSVQPREGDFIFEAEVTPNRPDWLSILGIAREVAAVTGLRLKVKTDRPGLRPGLKRCDFSLSVENSKDCPLYSLKIIRGLKVASSPLWLRRRLEGLGCRSVNNIVDLTNYILFKYGQPLHAFDLDKLQGEAIAVRRGRQGESIITIDGETKELTPEILVIADAKRPVAVAGVMGGKDTEVSDRTSGVLLEAAVFNPVLVRRGKRALGITSESAYRFERGVDHGNLEKASLEAAELMLKLAGGNYRAARALGARKRFDRKISLDSSRVARTLGVKIPDAKIKKILSGLGLKVNPGGKGRFTVKAPSFRVDLASEIDLVEEVVRIFGYDRIPSSIPSIFGNVTRGNAMDLVAFIKSILVGLGLNEVFTYSLIDKKSLQDSRVEAPAAIGICNPLSREQEVLRPSLVPSLLKCVSYNLNQKQASVGIFEIARVFSLGGGGPREDLTLGIALSGERAEFLEQGQVKDRFGMLHLKGAAEVLFQRLGIKDFQFSARGKYAADIFCGGEKIGVFLNIKRSALDSFDIKNKQVVAAELSLGGVFKQAGLEKRIIPLPLYPGISRDISLILKEDTQAADILAVVREEAGSLLEEVRITDYYYGQQIPAGYKGITVSCFYRSGERTLTEDEISPLHQRVCRALEAKLSARFR